MDYQYLLKQTEVSKFEIAGEAAVVILAFVAVFLWLWAL